MILSPASSMKIFRISAGSVKELEDALLLNPDIVKSSEELELAKKLADDSFSKKNIAKKFKYEFLLWLTGKTDIKSAMKSSYPENPKNMLLVVFKGSPEKIIKTLKAAKKPLKLKKNAEPLDIERISLSRI